CSMFRASCPTHSAARPPAASPPPRDRCAKYGSLPGSPAHPRFAPGNPAAFPSIERPPVSRRPPFHRIRQDHTLRTNDSARCLDWLAIREPLFSRSHSLRSRLDAFLEAPSSAQQTHSSGSAARISVRLEKHSRPASIFLSLPENFHACSEKR